MKKIKIILEMIKFEHTVFALPFAFLGAVLSSLLINGHWPTLEQWIWITLAMVGARSAAMSLNRLIDAKIDAANPRTKDRAIPAGLLSRMETGLFIAISFLVLIFSAFQLNMLAVYLLPLAVFFLVIYSYTKRFTYLCHVILGITIGIAPLGGWVGATGTLTWEAILLFLAVALWTAGFDVIYATQDADYDREVGLHSIPSRFGIKKALIIAKGFHVFSFIAMAALFFATPLGWFYLLGVIAAGGIMVYEHSIVSADDLSRVGVAFFTMNGVISIILLFFTIGDLLI
ncbi:MULTISPECIES: UbiA-like polyprenyltransferase [Alteribacter]|uniref:4-hydroxybenzoate polyprenyltransferase n=1 Tax=Alteribacter keqinensis TaxID=2483800 RepID=A0A3M7TV51_9BACI|nr:MULTISPECIES: UbiA-like polyprenyltransferase [Alteribacter]MBM7094657.1 UbiA family prenyltransferase [Alteribacter salitolerans]RNA69141.1 4-hydroxybenzoate octaprenyltransferase [Alteribacter keqinensis]